MQPLRKCEERQQNSFSCHCLNPQCPPRSSESIYFSSRQRATFHMQSLRKCEERQQNNFGFRFAGIINARPNKKI